MDFKHSFAITGLILSGCSTTNTLSTNTFFDTEIDTRKEIIRTPNLQEINTIDIGENLYQKLFLTPKNTYSVKINGNIEISSDKKERNYYWLLLGIPGAAIMELTADEQAITDNDTWLNAYDLRTTEQGYAAICPNENYCLIDKDWDDIFDHISIEKSSDLKSLKTPINYTKTLNSPSLKEGDFKYIALYQGKVDNKIRVSFREFYNNLSRPNFTQDIEYEYNEDSKTIIGFKGLRIEVLSAGNQTITYKVLSDFN